MEIKGMGPICWGRRLTPSARIADNTNFEEMLQLRISQTDPASSAKGPDSEAGALERSVRVLDLLDDFAEALADPRKSLKELEPLVLKVEGELGTLEAAAEPEADSDPSLSRLTNDVSVLASVALMKFHRGDYV